MDDDFENILHAEELILKQNLEIKRISNLNKLDCYAIFDIDPRNKTEDEINILTKKKYKSLSLLIHPDKTKNEKAEEIFDKISKAKDILLSNSENENDFIQKKKLISIYKNFEINYNNIPIEEFQKKVSTILDDDTRLNEIHQLYENQQKAKQSKLFVKIEQEKEKKKEFDVQWEEDRPKRIQNWQLFLNKVKSKRSKYKKKLEKKSKKVFSTI